MPDRLALQRRSLYRFIVRHVREPWTAEDLTQEALTRFLNYRRTGTVLDPESFCRQVAMNLVRDHFRSQAQRPANFLDDELVCMAPLQDEIIQHRQRVALFQQELDLMPPLRREVFIRRRVHGDSLGNIAETLGLSDAAVQKHMVRAARALRRAFDRTNRLCRHGAIDAGITPPIG